MKTVKTAISLPADLYENIEKLRKSLGKSRSEIFVEGLAKVLREAAIKDKEARDAAAYLPPTKAELAEIMSVTQQAWARLDESDRHAHWEDFLESR